MTKKEQAKAAKIILIHGDKGGCGKSLVASVLLDDFLGNRDAVIAIESDTRTPDIYRRFRDHLQVEKIDLKDLTGWMDFGRLLEENPGKEFVVNLPAGVGEFFAEEGDSIAQVLAAMGRDLAIYWPINRLADGLISLSGFLKNPLAEMALETGGLVVVKNGFFGTEKQFGRWDGSNVKKELSGRPGFRETYLPELHERPVDLVTVPWSVGIENAAELGIHMFERGTLTKWIKAAKEALC